MDKNTQRRFKHLAAYSANLNTCDVANFKNNSQRNVTCTRSSHGGYQGWSAGSTIVAGYNYAGENHAIQPVNIYLES